MTYRCKLYKHQSVPKNETLNVFFQAETDPTLYLYFFTYITWYSYLNEIFVSFLERRDIFFSPFVDVLCAAFQISNTVTEKRASIYIYKHHFIECNWNDFSFSMLQTHNTCGYAIYMQSIKALLMSKLMLCYKCNPYANIIMYLCKYCN